MTSDPNTFVENSSGLGQHKGSKIETGYGASRRDGRVMGRGASIFVAMQVGSEIFDLVLVLRARLPAG
jgi:hypothetical protein